MSTLLWIINSSFIKHIFDAMAIENFLNPVEEEEILLEFESVETKEFILDNTRMVEINENQEAVEVEVIALYSDLSKEEQLKAVAMALAVFEKWKPHSEQQEEIVVSVLQGVQWKIRRELDSEKQEKQRQLVITQYLR